MITSSKEAVGPSVSRLPQFHRSIDEHEVENQQGNKNPHYRQSDLEGGFFRPPRHSNLRSMPTGGPSSINGHWLQAPLARRNGKAGDIAPRSLLHSPVFFGLYRV